MTAIHENQERIVTKDDRDINLYVYTLQHFNQNVYTYKYKYPIGIPKSLTLFVANWKISRYLSTRQHRRLIAH
ncbi:MAG TPA: hypothetical protein V6D16_00920 [Candidatus Obscuribacterales bacterium]